MNTITALLGAFSLAVMGAIGYVFYIFAGPVAGGLFVGISLVSAIGAQYVMGNQSGNSGGGARVETRSKGARNREE